MGRCIQNYINRSMAEMFKILDEKLDENESKRIKMDIEKKDICTTDQSIVPVPSVRKGKSNELARTSYIFERLKGALAYRKQPLQKWVLMFSY